MSLDVGLVVAAMRHLLSEVDVAASTMSNALPDRQFITTGGAVYDCAQVSVSANSLATGIAGNQDPGGGLISNCPPGWNANIELAIVRDALEAEQVRGRRVSAPKVADIEIDAIQADKDAAALTKAIESLAGPEWDQYGAVPASIQFGETQGGLFAVVLTVTLNLWGIEIAGPV